MSIAQSFIRALANKGSIYLPYSFSGEWSEAEEAIMAASIDPHVPERVDAMFNNWRFRKASDDHFMARKASWVMSSLSARSAEELAEKITGYYNRYPETLNSKLDEGRRCAGGHSYHQRSETNDDQ